MDKRYKYSQFNIIADQTSDKVLIYNTYTLNYRWIGKPDLDDIKDKFDIDLGDVPICLADEGYIVPSDQDEIQKLKTDVQSRIERADSMFLSIFTTLACNYRCVYCFEKDQLCQTEYMTLETADEILNFIKKRYEEHQFTKPLKIKWFGGEPLLNMEIIRYISKLLISNNIKYSAKMYTNGRLLTKEIAEELKSLHVTDEVVIPIDGLASTYAELKECKEEDFYKTIENIKAAEDMLNIVIHINVSEASKNDVEPLYKMLTEKYKIKSKIVAINVAPQNTNTITDSNNMDLIDFQKAIQIVNKNKALRIIKRGSGCEARHPDYYVIGTHGELYICEHLVGQPQYIAGNIKDIQGSISRADTIWDNNRIIDECNDCPILPICMGFCTSQRYIDNIDCRKEDRIEITRQRLLKIVNSDKLQK